MPKNENGTHNSQTRLVALNIRIPLSLRRELRVLAAKRGVTMTSVILGLLEGFCGNDASHEEKRAR